MPVILGSESYDLWLNAKNTKPETLAALLAPYSAEEMQAFPIGTRVNNPAYDGPLCIERI